MVQLGSFSDKILGHLIKTCLLSIGNVYLTGYLKEF